MRYELPEEAALAPVASGLLISGVAVAIQETMTIISEGAARLD
jgi:hypothetical protein